MEITRIEWKLMSNGFRCQSLFVRVFEYYLFFCRARIARFIQKRPLNYENNFLFIIYGHHQWLLHTTQPWIFGTCFWRLAIEVVVITSKILASSIQLLLHSDCFESIYIIQRKIAKNRIEIAIELQAIDDEKKINGHSARIRSWYLA